MDPKIAVHITHYQNNKKSDKENLLLKKIISAYLSISKNVDIFIHSNKKYFCRNKSVKCIIHKLKNEHPFYLSWKCRKLLFNQRESYDFFIYGENDILFTPENFLYWKEFSPICLRNRYNLGFVLAEDRKSKGLFSVNIFRKLTNYIFLEDEKFIINNSNPYCALWIMGREEFNKFVKSNVWKFDWKKNYQCYGDIRAMSAISWHGINMENYKSTIIPIKKLRIDKNSIILHLNNKYSITKHGPGSLKFNDLLSKNLAKLSNYHDYKILIKKIMKNFFNI
jgi:hypothetical protein